MKYAIKRPTDGLWKTNLSEEKITQKYKEGEIQGDWLICPQGEADRAVTISDFAMTPLIFGAEDNDVKRAQVVEEPMSVRDFGCLLFIGSVVAKWALSMIAVETMNHSVRGFIESFGQEGNNLLGATLAGSLAELLTPFVWIGAVVMVGDHVYSLIQKKRAYEKSQKDATADLPVKSDG